MTVQREHVIYRLHDANGALLYVGHTSDIATRIRSHKREKAWWPEVMSMETTAVASKQEAVEAERMAIQTESPLHNMQLVPGFRMVVKSFRIPEPDWLAVVARADREGLNPTEVVRQLAIAWGQEEA